MNPQKAFHSGNVKVAIWNPRPDADSSGIAMVDLWATKPGTLFCGRTDTFTTAEIPNLLEALLEAATWLHSSSQVGKSPESQSPYDFNRKIDEDYYDPSNLKMQRCNFAFENAEIEKIGNINRSMFGSSVIRTELPKHRRLHTGSTVRCDGVEFPIQSINNQQLIMVCNKRAVVKPETHFVCTQFESNMNRTTIAFRLPDADLARLGKLADEAKVSIHECARDFVIRSLHVPAPIEPAPKALHESLDLQLSMLRSDIGVTLEALLIATKVFTPEEAREFVAQKLPR